MKAFYLILIAALCDCSAMAQPASDATYRLTLPNHDGQLKWSASGFRIIQSSAKPDGQEIGIRGRDDSGRLTFLGFLFLVREGTPLTSEKCCDSTLDNEKKSAVGWKVLNTSEIGRAGQPPVSILNYKEQGRDGTQYVVRGFVASGDICGDLEFYSAKPISSDDADLKSILLTYDL